MGKNALFYIWFITILFLLSSANADAVKKLTIADILNQDRSLSESINILITGNNKTQFLFSLPENSQNITVNGEPYGANNSLAIPLACINCNIDISYSLDEVATQSGNDLIFSRTLNFPDMPEEFSYSIMLPSGYLVERGSNLSIEQGIVPIPTRIDTDGKNIQIHWNMINPVLPQSFFVKYSMANPVTSVFLPYLPWFFLVLLIGFSLGYLAGTFLKKMPRTVETVKNKSYVIPSSLLNPDEKIIIALLKEHDNVIGQKEVGKTLQWSKSKVSAIMTNLEYKKIIEREKTGRNYKARLIKEISEGE